MQVKPEQQKQGLFQEKTRSPIWVLGICLFLDKCTRCVGVPDVFLLIQLLELNISGIHNPIYYLYHRKNAGTLGMVPLTINPIYTLYSAYLLGRYIPLLTGSNRRVKQLGYQHQLNPTRWVSWCWYLGWGFIPGSPPRPLKLQGKWWKLEEITLVQFIKESQMMIFEIWYMIFIIYEI